MASHAVSRPSPAATTPVAASPTDYPATSLAFEWVMGVLSALLLSGLIQDGWAHAHGMVDQSFLTPWHAILYSMMALNGFVLGGVAIRNRLAGYPVARTLPYGYWLALIGVIIFAIGGGLDLVWHTLFGIENGIDGLISPSHLLLAFAAMLIFSGPIRSAARRFGPQTSGWAHLGPMVLGVFASLTLLAFFLGYAQPIEDGFTTSTVQRGTSAPLVASLYSVDFSGATLQRLTVPPNLDIWGITASPDGRRIAYRAQAPQPAQSGATVASDVYVADPDGSHVFRVTHSGRHDTQVAWSPDGAWLAYISMPAGTSGNHSLHVVRPDGSGDRRLVDGVTTLSLPAWSPDGSRVAYASRNGLDDEIALVDVKSGTSRWLAFTKGANAAVFAGDRLVFAGNDGALRSVALDGSNLRTLVQQNASGPAVSADGKHLAYLAPAGGSTQLFVADADGTHARNVSQLSGMDAQHPAFGPNGKLFFTATGRPSPEHTFTGFALAESANLLEAVLLAGLLLLALRRWRVPPGTFTLILTLFALAMAAQTDTYYDGLAALGTGILADVAVAAFGDRIRHGRGFYAFAFALPAVFFAFYLAATIAAGGGTAWAPNMLLGSPLLAGIAGLLVAFCYEPPLPDAVEPSAAVKGQ